MGAITANFLYLKISSLAYVTWMVAIRACTNGQPDAEAQQSPEHDSCQIKALDPYRPVSAPTDLLCLFLLSG